MSSSNQAPKKFRPERPVILNLENTGFKTEDQVIYAVEQLREKGWLCTYNEKVRPLHMSFNDEKEFSKFKKDCDILKIELKKPPLKIDDFEAQLAEDDKNVILPPEPKESFEDPSGKVHIVD